MGAHDHRLTLATGFVLLTAACSGGGTGGPEASPSSATSSSTSPDASATDGPTTPADTASADLGPVLVPADVVPRTAGIAWQVQDAVLLTSTSGTPLGHMPGWQLDREASDRLAAPVLQGGSMGTVAVTVDGLVPLDQALPLADGHTLVLADGRAEVRGRDGAVVTQLDAPDVGAVWVSATGSVVGVVDGEHWDVEAGAPLEVPAGCRTTDRHTADDPLLVCDDGHRLVGGDTAVTLPDDTPAGWVTVGTTGDEVLATVTADGHPAVWAGSLAQGTIEPWDDPGVGLFFRSNGDAWVAHLGPDSGLDVVTGMARTSRVRDVPPATDAAMWTR